MTAAEQLRRATETLRTMASEATPGPWEVDRFFWEIGSTRGMTDHFWLGVEAKGDVGGYVALIDDETATEDAAFIALMDPELAEFLVAVLTEQLTVIGMGYEPAPSVMALAEYINGRAS